MRQRTLRSDVALGNWITCDAEVPAGVTLGYTAMSDGAPVSGVVPR